jgi:hypothetical protein
VTEETTLAGLDVGVAAGLLLPEDAVTVAVQLDANGTADAAAAAAALLFFGDEKAGVVFGIWLEENTIEDMVELAAPDLCLETDPDFDLPLEAAAAAGVLIAAAFAAAAADAAATANSSSDFSAISSPRLTMICDKSFSGSLTRAEIMACAFFVDSMLPLITISRSACCPFCFSTSMCAPEYSLTAFMLHPPRPITREIAVDGTEIRFCLRDTSFHSKSSVAADAAAAFRPDAVVVVAELVFAPPVTALPACCCCCCFPEATRPAAPDGEDEPAFRPDW